MKWSEVRTLHPNKFVLLEKLKEHIDGNYKYIDEVALIDVIDNDKEASDLLVRCKGDRFVYHTSKEDLCKYAYIKRSFKMNIRYDNGLLFIDIKISYLWKSKLIKNVVIDTGASHTIISPDIVSSIGISASPLDKFITMYGIGGEHYAYRKKIDSISICGMDLKDIEIDFGVIDENGNINGLIGLDVLLELGVSIDLKNLKLKL